MDETIRGLNAQLKRAQEIKNQAITDKQTAQNEIMEAKKELADEAYRQEHASEQKAAEYVKSLDRPAVDAMRTSISEQLKALAGKQVFSESYATYAALCESQGEVPMPPRTWISTMVHTLVDEDEQMQESPEPPPGLNPKTQEEAGSNAVGSAAEASPPEAPQMSQDNATGPEMPKPAQASQKAPASHRGPTGTGAAAGRFRDGNGKFASAADIQARKQKEKEAAAKKAAETCPTPTDTPGRERSRSPAPLDAQGGEASWEQEL